MSGKIKITDEQLLDAIKATGGKTTGICEMLNITRPTLARYAKRPIIAEAIEFAHARLIDRAEYKLMEAIERGESWAVQLVLKDSKRGKERGYGNSVDVTSGGEALTIKIIKASDASTTNDK